MIDKFSDSWRQVAAWARGELATARERNEATGTPPAETEYLRGRIAVLCELLAMENAQERQVIGTPPGYGFQGPDEA